MAGLEGLARSLTLEALELRRERERALASRTLTGHVRNALGYALSLYCLLRRAVFLFYIAVAHAAAKWAHAATHLRPHACPHMACR